MSSALSWRCLPVFAALGLTLLLRTLRPKLPNGLKLDCDSGKDELCLTEERSSCDEIYPKYAFCKGSVDLCPVCMASFAWQTSSQKATEADEDQCFARLTDECCDDACCQPY